MSHPEGKSDTLPGTLAGTLASIFSTIHGDDLIRTVLLACVGATVSFLLSRFLGWMSRRLRR